MYVNGLGELGGGHLPDEDGCIAWAIAFEFGAGDGDVEVLITFQCGQTLGLCWSIG